MKIKYFLRVKFLYFKKNYKVYRLSSLLRTNQPSHFTLMQYPKINLTISTVQVQLKSRVIMVAAKVKAYDYRETD